MAEDNMSNIINNLKNVLNSNNTDSSSSSNNNLNITPEMINNLTNMIQSNNSKNTSNSSAESNNSIKNDSGSKNNNSNNIFSNVDFETVLKMKSIIETLNKKDDPRSNLLYSLKPYLRENRQKKLDQYVNLFKITQITDLLKKEKGDEN